MEYRSIGQKLKDFITLPLRALLVFEESRWGLSSTKEERIEYAAREVRGYCLDVGCGKHNLLVSKYLGGYGKGIDVFKYEGLTEENLVSDMTKFPFADSTFNSVTFVASLNHIPRDVRDLELMESYRCLKHGGNVIITMPCALAGVLIHKFVAWHDRLFKTDYDVDAIRGMHEQEGYYLKDSEIRERLTRAGFQRATKKYFLTQWGMNHLFLGWKD